MNSLKKKTKLKQGNWLIVHPTDCFTMLPVWQCSSCKQLTSGYTPDEICEHCGSRNKEDTKHSVELAIFGEV